MIGKIPKVLKMNIKINRVICFFVPAFQRAIPFQIMSRTISTMSKNTVVWANTCGAACAAIAVVWVSITIY